MSFGESWKTLGNNAFKSGDFATAVKHYSQAIEAESTNASYFVNRSLAHASLKEWKESAVDATSALKLDSKYVKAHFRLVKALLATKRYKDARFALSNALKECGENLKELKELEQEILTITGIPLRPKSTDFEVVGELGDGNFSKVYKAILKSTKETFAVKAIERVVVDKMKRRHPNIQNEIMMEKRALHKLDHPGIVQLFSTFQDYGTLYYQMEFVSGGDLWTSLHEIIYDTAPVSESTSLADAELAHVETVRKGTAGAQVGMHWSILRFYLAQMISAVEHMHRRGIIHRDIKPENIMVTNRGLLKFVDFGTAKDIQQTDLNGPEFVGTPEYMCHGTVNVKSGSTVGMEADIWALGVTLYQMVLGYTAFAAPSPFLTFLRIKRAKVILPDWVPEPVAKFIRLLLTKDAHERMALASDGTVHESLIGRPPTKADMSEITDEAVSTQDPSVKLVSAVGVPESITRSLSYDALRNHAFFVRWKDSVNWSQVQSYHSLYPDFVQTSHDFDLATSYRSTNIDADADPLSQLNIVREVYHAASYVAGDHQEVTTASALCNFPSLHDICLRAVGEVAVQIAFATASNGGVKPSVPWMQKFQLTPQRISANDRQRVMHYLERKQKLQIPSVYRLFFRTLPESRCLRANTDSLEYLGFTRSIQGHYNKDFHFAYLSNPNLCAAYRGSLELEDEREICLKTQIAAINKLRPKFVVISGDFVARHIEDNSVYDAFVERFRKLVARISDTISVLFVPGPGDLGHRGTSHSLHSQSIDCTSLDQYRSRFGADYYSFWFEGTKGIVLNSSLFLPHLAENEFVQLEAQKQLLWFEEEIEQAKLCATSIVLFTYHSWFDEHLEEVDGVPAECPPVIPRDLRIRLLKLARHHKVKIAFCGVKDRRSLSSEEGNQSKKSLRPFCKVREEKDSDAADIADVDDVDVNLEDGNAGPGKAVDPPTDDEDEDGYVNEEDNYEGPEMLFAPNDQFGGISMVLVQEHDAVHREYSVDPLSSSPHPTSMQILLEQLKSSAR